MNTKQAAIGRWAEIYKYYGLPGITGKNHLKANALFVVVQGNSAVMIKTAPGHISAYAAPVMDGRCLQLRQAKSLKYWPLKLTS